jgi:hypothetical protein
MLVMIATLVLATLAAGWFWRRSRRSERELEACRAQLLASATEISDTYEHCRALSRALELARGERSP